MLQLSVGGQGFEGGVNWARYGTSLEIKQKIYENHRILVSADINCDAEQLLIFLRYYLLGLLKAKN